MRVTKIIVVFLFSVISAAAEDRHNAANRLDELLRTIIARDSLPSLSLAIWHDGRVVYSAAFGFADLEDSTLVTPRSIYRIGSVSKTITSVAAMTLVEEGSLDLDAAIQQYCPAFPDKATPVTARLLLAHQSGIRDYNYQKFAEEYLSQKHYDSCAEAIAVFKDDSLIAEPGTKYKYSSYNYNLLGCVMEGASGTTYEELVQSQVLTPTGMTSTRLEVARSIVPRRVKGYGRSADGQLRKEAYVDLSDRYPSGGFLSTPEDLVRFAGALLSSELLPATRRAEMWTKQKTKDGKATGYGLGWRISEDQKEVYHGGSSVGFSAYLHLQPEQKLAIAFATNLELWNEPRHQLAQDVAKIFLK